jgi:hypothetical protein
MKHVFLQIFDPFHLNMLFLLLQSLIHQHHHSFLILLLPSLDQIPLHSMMVPIPIHLFQDVQIFISIVVALVTTPIEVVLIVDVVVAVLFLLTSLSAKYVINGVIWQITAIIGLIYDILVILLLNIRP